VHIQYSKRWRNRLWLLPAVVATLAAAQAVAADPHMVAFASENNAAMTKMMSGMHIKSSGDIDRDFAAMMIAHHQGAIEMAQAQLRYGKNEVLRRIAQEIIVDQLQEIAVMRMALGESLPPSAPVPTQVAAPHLPSSKPPPDRSITPIKNP
jgi:methionine-rich copper-binding protein CopC